MARGLGITHLGEIVYDDNILRKNTPYDQILRMPAEFDDPIQKSKWFLGAIMRLHLLDRGKISERKRLAYEGGIYNLNLTDLQELLTKANYKFYREGDGWVCQKRFKHFTKVGRSSKCLLEAFLAMRNIGGVTK